MTGTPGETNVFIIEVGIWRPLHVGLWDVVNGADGKDKWLLGG